MARRPAKELPEEREKSRKIGALKGLWPFLRPYRGLMAAALVALVLTASISLILPIAVRRVVDGFSTATIERIDQYFLAALGVALALALARGCATTSSRAWASGWWPISARRSLPGSFP